MNDEKTRTGIERFYERYPKYPRPVREVQPEYLGVGAPMVDPTDKVRVVYDKLFVEDMRDY